MADQITGAIISAFAVALGIIINTWSAGRRHRVELTQSNNQFQKEESSEQLEKFFIPFWKDLSEAVVFVTGLPMESLESTLKAEPIKRVSAHAIQITAIADQDTSEPLREAIFAFQHVWMEQLKSRIELEPLLNRISQKEDFLRQLEQAGNEEEMKFLGFHDGSAFSQAAKNQEIRRGRRREFHGILEKEISNVTSEIDDRRRAMQQALMEDLIGWQVFYTELLVAVRSHLNLAPLDVPRHERFLNAAGLRVKERLDQFRKDIEAQNEKALPR